MIARVWRCTVTQGNLRPYLDLFEQTVLARVNALDGFHEVRVIARDADGLAELTFISLWESMEAIAAYTGGDFERAVVAPDAQALLHSFEPRVTHHTVVLHAGPDVPSPDLPPAGLAG